LSNGSFRTAPDDSTGANSRDGSNPGPQARCGSNGSKEESKTSSAEDAPKALPKSILKPWTPKTDAQPEGWQQDSTTTEQQSSWKALLGGLRKGSDITSMLIPAEFIRPESSLERIQDTMQHGRLLEDIARKGTTPVERMKAVVRFHVSGIIRAIFDGKKPYNPVLGETCAWNFDHASPGMSETKMVCEQVSHHPPISAFYLFNKTLGLGLEGYAEICPRFTGNTIVVPFKGERRLQINHLGEVYVMTVANLVYRGLFVGSRGAEWTGTVKIACARTGLRCKLDLKPLGMLGMWGTWHRVEGTLKAQAPSGKKVLVGTISGNWDKVLYYTDSNTPGALPEVLYDFEAAAASSKPKTIQPPQAVLPTDSKVVWRDLSDALGKREMKRANQVKIRIESQQREIAAKHAKDGVACKPRFFAKGRPGSAEALWCPKLGEIEAFASSSMLSV